MAADRTEELQALIDRLRRGDAGARMELVGQAYERLRRLAKKILHQSFPRLEHVYSTQTVLHEAAIRFLKALEVVNPASVKDFFRFAAFQFRRTLLNLARRYDRKEGKVHLSLEPDTDCSRGPSPNDLAVTTVDPAKLALWTEFHEKVNALPDVERAVVDLYWYQGLSQGKTAELLGLSKSAVSRLWHTAIQKLPSVPG